GDQSTVSDPNKPTGIRRRAMLFSLIASILIWLMLSLSENYYLPVEYTTCATQTQEISSACISGIDEDSVLSNPLPETIRATLYGPGISLLVQRFRARYLSSPITFSPDAGMLDTQLLLRIPEELSIESIFPEKIYFQKEAKIERRIPIESRVTFVSQPPHFFVGEHQLNPDTILVSGPTSIVSQITSWPTEADTVVGASDTVYYEVTLVDSLSGWIRKETNNTVVRKFAPQYTEGQIEQVRVEIQGLSNANNTVQLEPRFVTITYQVPLEKFHEARQSQVIRAFVSYTQIYSDTTGRVEPRIEYPPELMLRQVTLSPNRLRYYMNIGAQ
ncbi:MAG: hypothetical protein OXF48_11145, partial [Bacteroidetes bacterium]|nr:hypothetical protein [Bacteroidota bacterium]